MMVHRRRARRGRFLKWRRAVNNNTSQAIFTGVIGAFLIVLALPRVGSELFSVGASPVRESLDLQKPVKTKDLADAADDLDTAIAIDGADAKRLTDRGLIALIEAERLGVDTEGGKKRLEEGMKFLERGLSENPGNSFAWARLAQARLRRDGGPSPGVFNALRMSYQTGPYADDIMNVRANLSLQLWERLDAGLKAYAKRELAYLWTDGVWPHQKQIIEDVCNTDRAFVLSQALRDSPEAIAEFDRLYPYLMTPVACREDAVNGGRNNKKKTP